VTGAVLELAVNPVGGGNPPDPCPLIIPLTVPVIFQQYVTSPKTAARNLWNKDPLPEELPKLRALSDLMWGVWNRDNPNTKNIRYFWAQGVANRNTKALIARALKGVDKKLEKWPGTSFNMDDDAGRAILGTSSWLGMFGGHTDQHYSVRERSMFCFLSFPTQSRAGYIDD